MPSPILLLSISLFWLFPQQTNPAPPGATGSARSIDYDAAEFSRDASVLQSKGVPPDGRARTLDRLVVAGPRNAADVIATALDDPSDDLRKQAGQYLSLLRDERGLRRQAACVTNPDCIVDRAVAIRLLGAADRSEFAPVLRAEVLRLFTKGMRDGQVQLSAPDLALLTTATIALARLDEPGDLALLLRVVETCGRGVPSEGFLEALGYLRDSRVKNLLWDAYRASLGTPSCKQADLGVLPLLALSRHDDPLAIARLKDIILGIGLPATCTSPFLDRPFLPPDRQSAIEALKPRDAPHFASALLAVAAQSPETAGTREAWIALVSCPRSSQAIYPET